MFKYLLLLTIFAGVLSAASMNESQGQNDFSGEYNENYPNVDDENGDKNENENPDENIAEPNDMRTPIMFMITDDKSTKVRDQILFSNIQHDTMDPSITRKDAREFDDE